MRIEEKNVVKIVEFENSQIRIDLSWKTDGFFAFGNSTYLNANNDAIHCYESQTSNK